ncbi:MAG: VOC family protein [Acidobacteriota bacterium]
MSFRRPTSVRLPVAELERALDFYHGRLNLPVALRVDDRAELQTETIRLELIEMSELEATPVSPLAAAICWEVDDLAATAARLTEAGLELDEERDLGVLGRRRGFVDPDGHLLELVEYPDGRGAPS